MIAVLCFVYFYRAKLDPDTARNMLSALIQSEAAILALVISASLIIVQITASSYRAFVIKEFIKKYFL